MSWCGFASWCGLAALGRRNIDKSRNWVWDIGHDDGIDQMDNHIITGHNVCFYNLGKIFICVSVALLELDSSIFSIVATFGLALLCIQCLAKAPTSEFGRGFGTGSNMIENNIDQCVFSYSDSLKFVEGIVGWNKNSGSGRFIFWEKSPTKIKFCHNIAHAGCLAVWIGT